MSFFTYYESPVGKLTVASGGGKIEGLWIEGQRHFIPPEGNIVEAYEIPALKEAVRWLESYFSGEKPCASGLALAPAGSEFQLLVWEELLKIPYGETVTYGEIAKEIARKTGREHMSPQAVGGAVGRNPISIIIPCHRVIGAGGRLTGYAGGIDKKEWLLRHEGAVL